MAEGKRANDPPNVYTDKSLGLLEEDAGESSPGIDKAAGANRLKEG